MSSALEFPDALKSVAYARALAEVEKAPLAGFLVLLVGTVVSIFAPRTADWRLSLGIAMGLVLAPPFLTLALPRRGLLAYRLSLVLFLANGGLIAIIGYREIGRIVSILGDEFPLVQAWGPWVAPLFSALYYVLQFHGWKERLLRLPAIREVLADPPPEAARREIRELLSSVLAKIPGGDQNWAEFRTVSAGPRNWRLFLKLDPEIHGTWRAAFCPEYAVVVFRDGSRAEAVKRHSLKIVAEDPSPGTKTIQCLLRWNNHLHEGRITPDHFYRIQAWNKAD